VVVNGKKSTEKRGRDSYQAGSAGGKCGLSTSRTKGGMKRSQGNQKTKKRRAYLRKGAAKKKRLCVPAKHL